MNEQWILSPSRQLTDDEKKLVWKKPLSHKTSEQEFRISNEVKRNWYCEEMKITNILLEGDAGSGKTELAKALSANFGLPYTKVTCFADMDKSDVIGAILPVLSETQQSGLDVQTMQLLKILYRSESLPIAVQALQGTEGLSEETANSAVRELTKLLKEKESVESVTYRFYPSEIVRAFEKGYILEIQEPTVIRDAAVLMALNSALEPGGSINLTTRVVERHPDFIAVITTNRGYNGCRPLNEALRDRVQHAEKMDLPSPEVMAERAAAKTGYSDDVVLALLADAICLLDQTARANAIKGVAGMRSYFYWVDAVAKGSDVKESLYHKVIYKITTDPDEIAILEEGLTSCGMMDRFDNLQNYLKKNETMRV